VERKAWPSPTVCMIVEVGAVNASVGNAASNRKKTRIARGSARQTRGEFSGRGTRANVSAPFSSRVWLLSAKPKREKEKERESKQFAYATLATNP